MATPISNMTVTWNNAGTTFNAIKMNVTDTASNAASLLMDLQVGGASKFKVDKSGNLTFGTAGSSSVQNINGSTVLSMLANTVLLNKSSGNYGFAIEHNNNRAVLYQDYSLTFAGGNSAPDVLLARDAANTLALRNATNAQTFRIYNTYTDASNYERLRMSWVSNVLEIGTEAAGTGSTRGIGIAIRDITNGALVLRNANTGRNGTFTILANPSSDQYFQAQNGTGTAIVWSGNEIAFGSVLGFQLRHRQDTGRACWGLNSNFPLANTSFQFRSVATGDTVLAVQAITSQTGDLQQWVDSAGTALTSVLVDGAIQMKEQTAPAAPAANAVRIYAEDNGAGKTRLMALFNTGVAQQIAIEP